jgi:hypothetical protein
VKTEFDDVIESLLASMTDYTTPDAMSEEYNGSPINAQTFLYSSDHNLEK